MIRRGAKNVVKKISLPDGDQKDCCPLPLPLDTIHFRAGLVTSITYACGIPVSSVP